MARQPEVEVNGLDDIGNAHVSQATAGLTYNAEVPSEFIRNLGLDPMYMDNNQKDKLREIVQMLDGHTKEEKFISLLTVQNRLQSRLGRSNPMDLYERVWNWLKTKRVIRNQEARIFAMEGMEGFS